MHSFGCRFLTLLSILVPALLGGCGSTGTRPDGAGVPSDRPAPVADAREVRASDLSRADLLEFETSWRLFLTKDPGWPAARDRWLAKGGAAPYVLAENLFRYFWSATKVNRRAEIVRVSQEAGLVGEPATAYFVKALVTDRWPLKEPVTTQVFNPDNINQPITKTFTHYDIDDVTRQHAAYVLAGIGAPAVPILTSRHVLDSEIPSARRYGAYALGAIATDDAVQALGQMLRSRPEWQDRGAAAKALGFALLKGNAASRPLLEEAKRDPDDFVRRKAEEALAGKSRIEF